MRLRFLSIGVAGFLLLANGRTTGGEEPVDFRRDVRPLLSDHCFACHGPDEANREGGFRLDQNDGPFSELDSGAVPIVPGSAEASELFQRISSDDEDLRMPPSDSLKSLSRDEIALLKRWIVEGATWDRHWSFVAAKSNGLPEVSNPAWPANEIDYFVLAKLDAVALKPSAPAEKGTVLRRLALDLTGLPPTPDDWESFMKDDSDDAYERFVDHYLASPHYGEHQARFWLDAIRYADTHGLHFDNYREIWPFRDWVVRALNENQPFDEFATDQLAGDLFPEPTQDQLIASGFNRCNVTTNEGGSIQEEVHNRNVVDRVVTTATVFLGLTFDCTRCHDHKYDPLTQRDFYSLSAFFNSLDGPAMDGNAKDHAPVIRVLSDQALQRSNEIKQRIREIESDLSQKAAGIQYADPQTGGDFELAVTEFVWVEDASPAGSKEFGSWNHVHRPEPVFSGDTARVLAGPEIVQHYFTVDQQRWVIAEGDVFFAYVFVDDTDPPSEIMLQFNDGNWEHRAYWGDNKIEYGKDGQASRLGKGALPEKKSWARLEVTAHELGLKPGAKVNSWAFTQYGGKAYYDHAGILTKASPTANRDSLGRWIAAQRLSGGTQLPQTVREAIAETNKPAPDQDAPAQKTFQRVLRDYFLAHVWENAPVEFAEMIQKIGELKSEQEQLASQAPTSLVYRETKEPRPAHILKRGEYDKQGEQVSRATPKILPPLANDAPKNRLGLAQWLFDPGHPLTARVTVNRLWQQFFGSGLVKTSEDLGSQGTPPSHPALLDWMAVQFSDDGWDVKKTIKRIVMSSTYRQSSIASHELIRRDPHNRLLARGPRYRLDAEMLRDQALAVSQLLQRQLGGPLVKPPQPSGLWKAVGYVGSNTDKFVADTEADKIHRRTLYTFFKRTAPPPQMAIFDAPTREACCVRRERTNTPLQALLLLNDPQFLEAGRSLARMIFDLEVASQDDHDQARIVAMWRRCTMRNPTVEQRQALMKLLGQERARLKQDPHSVKPLLTTMGQDPPTEADAELAAWTILADVVLNADEVLNKN